MEPDRFLVLVLDDRDRVIDFFASDDSYQADMVHGEMVSRAELAQAQDDDTDPYRMADTITCYAKYSALRQDWVKDNVRLHWHS